MGVQYWWVIVLLWHWNISFTPLVGTAFWYPFASVGLKAWRKVSQQRKSLGILCFSPKREISSEGNKNKLVDFVMQFWAEKSGACEFVFMHSMCSGGYGTAVLYQQEGVLQLKASCFCNLSSLRGDWNVHREWLCFMTHPPDCWWTVAPRNPWVHVTSSIGGGIPAKPRLTLSKDYSRKRKSSLSKVVMTWQGVSCIQIGGQSLKVFTTFPV